MDPYRYEPTNRYRRDICLFRLHIARSHTDPLVGELSVVSLDNKSRYDAMSYVWGDPEPKTPIQVNEKPFSVGPNPHRALFHLRRSQRPRFLWIDAIYINQVNDADHTEEGHQFGMLGDIYKSAHLMRTWLDDCVDTNPEVFGRLKRLARLDHNMHYGGPVRKISFLSRLLAAIRIRILPIPYDVEFWTPLLQPSQNPYWKRLWILQELVLGRKVTFHCQNATLHGESLFRYISEFTIKSSINPGLPRTWISWIYFQDIIIILELLMSSRDLNASNPPDYLYGCLALASHQEGNGIEVDYSMGVTQVYAHVFRSYLCTYQYLNLPLFIFLNDSDEEPSWMPSPTKSSRWRREKGVNVRRSVFHFQSHQAFYVEMAESYQQEASW